MKKHLSIFNKDSINLIFSGKKKAEVRFSQKKIAPFGMIGEGDLVYLKPVGAEIQGQFFVSKVISFEGLDKKDWELIKSTYAPDFGIQSKKEESDYFKSHQNARYATIIYIDRVEQFITSPVKIPKKDLRGWVVL